MKERPIIFSRPMVRAILEGRKTVTRRVVKGLGVYVDTEFGMDPPEFNELGNDKWIWPDGTTVKCPYGVPGTRLWVREAWADAGISSRKNDGGAYRSARYRYRATDSQEAIPWKGNWKSPIHMPRWASRITLEVVSVRVERLQEITHQDAIAEGVEYDVSQPDGAPLTRFQKLWDSINVKTYPWSSNPRVCRIEFRRVES